MLTDELPGTVAIRTAVSDMEQISVPVIWEIPEEYDPAVKQEQSFTVNGTLDLSGTNIVVNPKKASYQNTWVNVTVAAAAQYRVAVASSENGTVTATNAVETAGDGTPLFYENDLVMLSIVPDEGYMLSTLSINGTPVSFAAEDDTYTFRQPREDVTVTATFEQRNEHTVTFDANGGSEPGDLPDGVTTAMPAKRILHNSAYYLPKCEFIAPEGKQFKAWQIGDAEYPVNASVTVTADVTVKALWENTRYDITVTNDGNGTGTAGPSTAATGTEITLSATPNTGYRFKEWQVISGGVTITNNKFTMPNDNVEVKAIFEKDAPPAPTEFTVTFDGNGGTPSVGSMTTTKQKLASLPGASRSGSYSFDSWYTEKTVGTKVTTATVFSANTTVYAHWIYSSSGGSYYTIKATAGAGGSISPSGNVSVREGRDQTFTITPDKGYTVSNVKIDGKSIGTVKSYTFEKVSRTHTIEVIFMKANSNPQTSVFVDVATGSYYKDAVDWAVENGITQGTDDTRFSPDGICTRAQAVTFLWRAAGSPEPETRTMPFTDVPVGSYYYDAVLWAIENGITKGTSDTTFSPNMTCSRAQIVTFLWRSEKSPAAGSSNPFTDVAADSYYADAVLRAVREGITKGTTNTTFSPDADYTRAQAVTFLWRCKK